MKRGERTTEEGEMDELLLGGCSSLTVNEGTIGDTAKYGVLKCDNAAAGR